MLEAMLALDAQAFFESRTLACESTLAEWVEAGWVGEIRHSQGGTERVLLDAGRAHVQPCLRLRSPSAVLRVPAKPHAHAGMSRYELLMLLVKDGQDGWTFQRVKSRKEHAAVKGDP